MDAKDIKKLLKSARESIDKKNFQEALIQLQKILDTGAEDYMTSLFCGLCFAEEGRSNESEKCYLQASAIDPSKPQAWQGIVNLYEKCNLTPSDTLENALTALINSTEEKEKKEKYRIKYCACLLSLKKEQGIEIAQDIGLQSLLSASAPERNSIALHLSNNFSGSRLSHEQISFVLELLEKVIMLTDQDLDPEFAKTVTSFFNNHSNLQALIRICSKILSFLPDDAFVLRKLIEALLLAHFTEESFLREEKEGSTKDYATYLPDYIVKLLQYFEEKQWKDVWMLICSEEVQSYKWASLLKLRCLIALSSWSEALDLAKSIKSGLIKEEIGDKHLSVLVKSQVELLCAKAHYRIHTTGDLQQALTCLNNVSTTKTIVLDDALILKSFCLVDLSQIEEADECFKNVSKERQASREFWTAKAWIKLSKNEISEAKEFIKKADNFSKTDAYSSLIMGKILWEEGKRDASVLREFLTAAKCDPFLSEAFYGMGEYYEATKGGTDKMLKCYERSWNLRKDLMTVKKLSDAYFKGEKRSEEHIKLLREAASLYHSEDKETSWIFLRLGLELVEDGKEEEAIGILQKLVSLHPEVGKHWEVLGDAYISRGSLESAIKAFQKALQLSPSSQYALFRIANIKLKCGAFSDAVETCSSILDQYPDFSLGRLLKAESLLRLSEERFGECRFPTSAQYLNDALECLAYLANKEEWRDTGLFWKTLGDAFIHSYKFPTTDRPIYPDVLLNLHSSADNSEVDTKRLGSRCYLKALKENPRSSKLWHDLGYAFLVEGKNVEKKDEKHKLTQYSIKSLHKSLELNSRATNSWISLGIAYVEEEADKSQHCLIKALEIESRNARAWTMLGFLYMVHKDFDRAHEVLRFAQSADPEYANGWCGQALVADSKDHYDTLDLLRHSSQMTNSPLISSMYGYKLLTSLCNKVDASVSISELDQIRPVCGAVNALSSSTYIQNNSCQSNLYRVLCEELNDHQISVKHLERSVKYAESQNKNDKAVGLSNLLRVYGKVGKEDEKGKVLEELKNENVCVDYSLSYTLSEAYAGNFSSALQNVNDGSSGDSSNIEKLNVFKDLLSLPCSDQKAPHSIAVSDNRDLKSIESVVKLLYFLLYDSSEAETKAKSCFMDLIELGSATSMFKFVFNLIQIFIEKFSESFLSGWLMHQFPQYIEVRNLAGRIEPLSNEELQIDKTKSLKAALKMNKASVPKYLHEFAGTLSATEFKEVVLTLL